MNNPTYEKTIEFLPQSQDPLYLPGVPADAVEDPTALIVDPAMADHHGIRLDAQGFPELGALEAWHAANNPHLFQG